MMEIEYFGNKELLKLHKIGFFCSRTVSGSAVMRCYDWATDVNVDNTVIVSGFQSKIEKDVLHFLQKRKAKIILVLARSIYKKIPDELQQILDMGNLLIVSTSPKASRIGKSTADDRNEYIASLCDNLIFGYIGDGSSLSVVLKRYADKSLEL